MVEPPPPPQCWLWNGLDLEACECIPMSDRGFRYGMSVFESMRVIDGRVDFLPEHLASISEAAGRKQFQFARESLERVGPLLRRISGSAFARIYITAGDGPPQAPATNCRVALICERRERVLPDAYSVVFQQGTYRNELENLKTGNYWPNITALSGAVNLGANEALLLNSHDRLVGCAMANVFLKIRGRWCTPCPEDGARRGVVREWAKAAIEAHSQSISRKEIDAASELFLTSSWIGVMPVTSLEGRSLERSAEIEDLRARLERFCADRSEEPAASTRSSP